MVLAASIWKSIVHVNDTESSPLILPHVFCVKYIYNSLSLLASSVFIYSDGREFPLLDSSNPYAAYVNFQWSCCASLLAIEIYLRS
jgi:hypothetical protein